jgi:hypothetical protein
MFNSVTAGCVGQAGDFSKGAVPLLTWALHELRDEPWEGLPEEEAPWEWDFVEEEANGPTNSHQFASSPTVQQARR